MATNLQEILTKYGDTLKEEVNVKEIGSLPDSLHITKVFKPLGSQLSAKFGKDTGSIIANGKKGNIRELGEGSVEVFDERGNTWTLASTDYEVVYEGLEGDNIAVEGNIIARLDLEITPELQREGVAREISRFLNQMRKDADFSVDAKVQLTYQTNDQPLSDILSEFGSFLTEEALLLSLIQSPAVGDIVAEFENDGKKVIFGLKK